MELTDMEKAIVRDTFKRLREAQQLQQAANAEVQRRNQHVEAVVNTVTRLRGLDPDKFRMYFDVDKDDYRLEPIPEQAAPVEAEVAPPPGMDGSKADVMTARFNGDGPPKDISGLIHMKEIERKINE